MNFNELGLTFWSLLSYFLFHQRTKESSVVDRKFAGMFDRPSSWVGAAHNCLIAITGSIAKRQCFTIELDTEHRGKSTLAPVPGNKKADGETIGLSFLCQRKRKPQSPVAMHVCITLRVNLLLPAFRFNHEGKILHGDYGASSNSRSRFRSTGFVRW